MYNNYFSRFASTLVKMEINDDDDSTKHWTSQSSYQGSKLKLFTEKIVRIFCWNCELRNYFLFLSNIFDIGHRVKFFFA